MKINTGCFVILMEGLNLKQMNLRIYIRQLTYYLDTQADDQSPNIVISVLMSQDALGVITSAEIACEQHVNRKIINYEQTNNS